MTDALRDFHFDMPNSPSLGCDVRNRTTRSDVVFTEFDDDDDLNEDELNEEENVGLELSDELKSKLKEYNLNTYLLNSNNSNKNVSFLEF